MNGHCDYRVSVVESSHIGPRFPIADCKPDSWLCGCPAGEHSMGLNCMDDKAKCRIAQRYEKAVMPSYAYRRRKRLPTLKEVAGRD